MLTAIQKRRNNALNLGNTGRKLLLAPIDALETAGVTITKTGSGSATVYTCTAITFKTGTANGFTEFAITGDKSTVVSKPKDGKHYENEANLVIEGYDQAHVNLMMDSLGGEYIALVQDPADETGATFQILGNTVNPAMVEAEGGLDADRALKVKITAKGYPIMPYNGTIKIAS